MKATLTGFVHGESKVGKSWLGATAPAPRLILDAEGRAKRTPGRKIRWDPQQYAPPVADGTWDTCIVQVMEFDTIQQTYNWLQTGEHPFVSFILDSIMEAQKRCIDKIRGSEQMMTQDWGELLRRLESLVRTFRDLVLIESNPLAVAFFISGTKLKDGKQRPLLQGQFGDTVPYYMDLCGYMYSVLTPDQTDVVRYLLTQERPGFVAGDGTDTFPAIIENPNIAEMFEQVRQKEEAA
jgi:hypothetical protein